jgi:hypothetical protein
MLCATHCDAAYDLEQAVSRYFSSSVDYVTATAAFIPLATEFDGAFEFWEDVAKSCTKRVCPTIKKLRGIRLDSICGILLDIIHCKLESTSEDQHTFEKCAASP